MSAVLILQGGKPNRLAIAANRADGPWFAENPSRNHHVRRPTPIERLQAQCIHGRPEIGQEWLVAARRNGPGLIERRFASATAGLSLNFDEPTSQWTFDGALIAGAAPQTDPENASPETAA